MFSDGFKERYTTIPFAVYRAMCAPGTCGVLSHQHREIELISVIGGAVDFYVDAEPYRLLQGDVLIVPPYSVHRAEIPQDMSCEYSCICFDPDLLWDEELRAGIIDRSLSVENAIRDDSPCAARLQTLIEEGCLACESSDDGWEMRAIGCISLIFGIMKGQGLFRSNLSSKPGNNFAAKVMEYISDNYTSPITSADAARALYMNNSYFCRLFKRAFGCPFSDYVLSYRLEKARIFLNNTTASVTEIAFSTGFHGSSYFCKAFKARFGFSPLACRKGK